MDARRPSSPPAEESVEGRGEMTPQDRQASSNPLALSTTSLMKQLLQETPSPLPESPHSPLALSNPLPQSSSNDELDVCLNDVITLMTSQDVGLAMKSQKEKAGKKKTKFLTFAAKDCVSWFVSSQIVSTRETAVELGEKLHSNGLIRSTQGEFPFQDNEVSFHVVERKSKEKIKKRKQSLGNNSSLEEVTCRRLTDLPKRNVSSPLASPLKVVEAMRNPVTGLKIKNRRFLMKTYYRCFTGQDAVTWIVAEGFAPSRAEAVTVGKKCLEEGFFSHVLSEHSFEDSFLFYCFPEDLLSQPARGIKSIVKSSSSSAQPEYIYDFSILPPPHRYPGDPVGVRFALTCDENFLGGTRAVVRRLIQQYEPVLNLFSKDSSPFITLLPKALSGRRALVSPLLTVHVFAGTAPTLIKHAFEKEVTGSVLETLFRMDTTYMQLISDSMKLSGRLYLADFVKSLLKKVGKLAHRMGSCDWKKEAAVLFEKFARKILRSTLPSMMRKVLAAGTQACLSLFPTPEDASRRIVIALFFLRFLVPGIVSPGRFLDNPPVLSANEMTILKYVGRGVQALASSTGGSTLSAEMRESFRSLMPDMDEFCTAFARNDPIPDEPTPVEWEELLICVSQIHLFMSNEYNHLISCLNDAPCPSPLLAALSSPPTTPQSSPRTTPPPTSLFTSSNSTSTPPSTSPSSTPPTRSPNSLPVFPPIPSPVSAPLSSPPVSPSLAAVVVPPPASLGISRDARKERIPSPCPFDLSNLPPALSSPPDFSPPASSSSPLMAKIRDDLSGHASCPLPERLDGKKVDVEACLKAALEDCNVRKTDFPSYFPHRPKDFMTPLINVPWKKEEFFSWWPVERALHSFTIVLYFSKVFFLSLSLSLFLSLFLSLSLSPFHINYLITLFHSPRQSTANG